MLMVVDVGNTNITLGVFDGDDLLGTFRITTKIPRTSDEYGITFKEILRNQNIKPEGIDDVAIASVVPKVMYSLVNGIKKYFKIDPFIVQNSSNTGIKIVTDNPEQIGTDRVVDVAASYEFYGGPCIVIDFGTATTYDLVLADGSFAAGVTAPGIRISGEALWKDAARLPEIEIKKPDSILAKETISSMQAGLVYGQIGQTEYIINQIKKESGCLDAKVVATGGLGTIIAKETDAIDIYDPLLTLKGLKSIREKN